MGKNRQHRFVISCVFVAQIIEQHLSLAAVRNRRNAIESRPPLICYTCLNVADNRICNRYAIDVPCPEGNNFCYTLHIMDSTGASVVVNKKCANSTECWTLGVGCLNVDSQTMCYSCCNEIYCNITVPTNLSQISELNNNNIRSIKKIATSNPIKRNVGFVSSDEKIKFFSIGYIFVIFLFYLM